MDCWHSNDVRKQAGVNNRNVVNENSLKYAKVIADNYWDKWDHDKTALELGENAIGGTSFSQESISRGYVPVKETTIDAVKQGIYNAMLDMIFDDAHSRWGHAAQLTGMGLLSFGDPDEIYFGFSIDKNGILHFENYEPMKADNSELFTIPDNTEQLQAQLKTAQTDLQTKQAAFDTAQAQNNSAQNALNASKSNLSQLEKELSDKQNELNKATDDLKAATTALTTARATLAQDEKDRRECSKSR